MNKNIPGYWLFCVSLLCNFQSHIASISSLIPAICSLALYLYGQSVAPACAYKPGPKSRALQSDRPHFRTDPTVPNLSSPGSNWPGFLLITQKIKEQHISSVTKTVKKNEKIFSSYLSRAHRAGTFLCRLGHFLPWIWLSLWYQKVKRCAGAHRVFSPRKVHFEGGFERLSCLARLGFSWWQTDAGLSSARLCRHRSRIHRRFDR